MSPSGAVLNCRDYTATSRMPVLRRTNHSATQRGSNFLYSESGTGSLPVSCVFRTSSVFARINLSGAIFIHERRLGQRVRDTNSRVTASLEYQQRPRWHQRYLSGQSHCDSDPRRFGLCGRLARSIRPANRSRARTTSVDELHAATRHDRAQRSICRRAGVAHRIGLQTHGGRAFRCSETLFP